MHAIGREIYHAGLTTIILTSTHAQASQAQRLRTDWSLFLNELKNASERLTRKQCWEWIWERNLTPFRKLEAARRT